MKSVCFEYHNIGEHPNDLKDVVLRGVETCRAFLHHVEH